MGRGMVSMQDYWANSPVVFYDLLKLPPSNLDCFNVTITFFADQHMGASLTPKLYRILDHIGHPLTLPSVTLFAIDPEAGRSGFRKIASQLIFQVASYDPQLDL